MRLLGWTYLLHQLIAKVLFWALTINTDNRWHTSADGQGAA